MPELCLDGLRVGALGDQEGPSYWPIVPDPRANNKVSIAPAAGMAGPEAKARKGTGDAHAALERGLSP
jgi:hypothetical protein